MNSGIRNHQLSSIIMAGALLLSLAPALYAAPRQDVPQDTQEWGHDVVRTTSTLPSVLGVGPSGATVQSSTAALAAAILRLRGQRAADSVTSVSATYCLNLAPSGSPATPYRLTFHFTSTSGTAANRSFDLATHVDTWATSSGDASLSGALYDQHGTLVAQDGASGRLAVALPAGQYSLVITGAPLDGTYVVTAEQGSCP
jgi:hypothetical protein